MGHGGYLLASPADFVVVAGRSQRWLTAASTNRPKGGLSPPPLPPSPSHAKQEFLKTQDPIQHMARLQKELDIVRERAAERLEQRLKKTVWQRLTDPLKRHSHSWINVGAVLLAYILAHNLYQTAKEKRKVQEEWQVAMNDRATYHDLLRSLLKEETVEQLATACVNELSKKETSPSSSSSVFWNKATTKNSKLDDSHLVSIVQAVLEEQLRQRIGDHILTDEERRIKDLQRAWEQSLQETVEISTTEDLVQTVLTGSDDTGSRDAINIVQDGPSTKKQRRVISM